GHRGGDERVVSWKWTTKRAGSLRTKARMHAGLLRPRPQDTEPSKSWVWRASFNTWNSGWTMSVSPWKVVAPVAEWTVTSTPALPASVTFWPLAPSGKTGLACRLTL